MSGKNSAVSFFFFFLFFFFGGSLSGRNLKGEKKLAGPVALKNGIFIFALTWAIIAAPVLDHRALFPLSPNFLDTQDHSLALANLPNHIVVYHDKPALGIETQCAADVGGVEVEFEGDTGREFVDGAVEEVNGVVGRGGGGVGGGGVVEDVEAGDWGG
jgi:hypothetical protein